MSKDQQTSLQARTSATGFLGHSNQPLVLFLQKTGVNEARSEWVPLCRAQTPGMFVQVCAKHNNWYMHKNYHYVHCNRCGIYRVFFFVCLLMVLFVSQNSKWYEFTAWTSPKMHSNLFFVFQFHKKGVGESVQQYSTTTINLDFTYHCVSLTLSGVARTSPMLGHSMGTIRLYKILR